MGAHPYPQTVGAANDWVLMMLAIRAHEKMVRRLLARDMWEAMEHTFRAANSRCVCVQGAREESAVSWICPEKLGKRGGRALWTRRVSLPQPISPKIRVNHRFLRGFGRRCRQNGACEGSRTFLV